MSDRDFQQNLEYKFKNPHLLETALTHSSYINEGRKRTTSGLNTELPNSDNERLEFLGDAIFDAIISEQLYNQLENVEEGKLSKLRAAIVCERSLAQCSRQLSLGKYLRLGKGEENTGGRDRDSILADAMEAVIAAVYLDGGWDQAQIFVIKYFSETIKNAIAGKLSRDYKTDIQEKLQSKGEANIKYIIEKEEGPDHNKVFFVNLSYNGKIIGSGSGKNKKEAEQNAAKEALERGGTFVF
ncbi:MAG: ribonuclease III [Anaerovoracaceae bacterium]